MFDIDRLREIWQTITRNKMRSLLTAFGVFWGIFLFILLIGIGTGFQKGLMNGISPSVANSMLIFSDKTTVPYKGFNAGRYWNMTVDDVELLRQNIPEIEYVSSTLYLGNRTLLYDNFSESFNTRAIDYLYIYVNPQILLSGRFINKIDNDERRKVCVIGDKICDKIFHSYEDAIGKNISIEGRYYRIIGVITSNGKVNIGGVSANTIFIPITVGQQIFNYGNEIHDILLSAYSNIDLAEVEPKVKEIIKAKHFISPNDQSAVECFNVHKIFLTFNNLFLGIKILIWIVGMGTLLAGVVGVSNIMLITIRERTKEIGIRRSLGAKPSTIIRQIVSESTLLTFIAGFSGFFFALLILVIIDSVISKSNEMFATPIVSFNLALLSIFIIVITGALAGIIPAKNALNIKAIDALRD